MNSIIDMIDNENFSIISQAAVLTNLMNIDNDVELNEILEDGIVEEDDDEKSFDNNVELPSTFTNMEGTNLTIDENWIMTQLTSKNILRESWEKILLRIKRNLLEQSRSIALGHIDNLRSLSHTQLFGL